MKGVVATHFKEYVGTKLGPTVWPGVMKATKLASDVFPPSADIPDEAVVNVIVAAANTAGKPVEEVLHEFGVFEMTKLFDVYAHLISQKTAKDFLLTAHDKIRLAVNKDFQGSGEEASCPFLKKRIPPLLEVKETSVPNELKLFYRSPRKLCAFNAGIIQAVAAHYKVKIGVTHKSCMNKGDAVCEYDVVISPA
jgi:predicted hydrocarbon binding protein